MDWGVAGTFFWITDRFQWFSPLFHTGTLALYEIHRYPGQFWPSPSFHLLGSDIPLGSSPVFVEAREPGPFACHHRPSADFFLERAGNPPIPPAHAQKEKIGVSKDRKGKFIVDIFG